MPIVELDIGGTPTRVQVDEGFTPEDLDHIAKSLAPKTVVPDNPTTGPVGRAINYITKRGRQVTGALERFTGFGESTKPGGPEPEQSVGRDYLDMATVAAPMVSPGLTAAGAAVGAGVSALGADDTTAELADMATNLGGGLVKGVTAGIRAGKEAKEVISEGSRLREMVPAMRQTVSAERGKLFDPIIGFLSKTGKTIKSGTPEGDKLGQALLEAQEDWGMVAGGGEKRVITAILDRLTGQVGELTAQELDDALKVLNKGGKAYATRRALTDGLTDLAKGTPAEGRLSAAGKEYFKIIKPAQHLATAIGKQNTPGGAAVTAIREWKKIAPASQKLLDPTGEVASLVKSASKGSRGGMALAGGMGAMGGVAYATQRLVTGDVHGAFMALLGSAPLMAMRAPGVVGAAARGAVPGVAKGAIGAAGVGIPAVQEGMDSPIPESPVGAPQDPGTQDLAPESTSAPEKPQGTFMREIGALSKLTGVPLNLIRAVVTRESTGYPGLTGTSGEYGLMQVMPKTFAHHAPEIERLTGRPASFKDNLDGVIAGVLQLRDDLRATGGNVQSALTRYNGGPASRSPAAREYGSTVARNYASMGQ